ncbi:VOC family protein [Lactococcus kimchii]|uniref:glyoxalase n=1 Tax=Lactococcus sp. S-13 TaxID=2507158 RepID=UPI001022AB62|nr:glyoxalase [Lactococcus sp. S-13]RZI49458.1 glyoxalase [Lactococcus sp. S-13]
MTIKMCTNLYVQNVKTEGEFFKTIGFVEMARQKNGETETLIFAPTAAGNARLQIWDIEFIRQVSPEVAEQKPSILFEVSDIQDWHEKVVAQGGFTSDLQEMGGKLTFNFQSPNGLYFAFMEE